MAEIFRPFERKVEREFRAFPRAFAAGATRPPRAEITMDSRVFLNPQGTTRRKSTTGTPFQC